MKSLKPLGFAISCLLILALLSGCWSEIRLMTQYLASQTVINQIRSYAETHDELTLKDAVNFQWDVVYNDVTTYGTGRQIKETYGIEFDEFEPFMTETRRRLFFCLEGELVRAVDYDFGQNLWLPTELREIYPDTVFSTEWVQVGEGGSTHTVLDLEPL